MSIRLVCCRAPLTACWTPDSVKRHANDDRRPSGCGLVYARTLAGRTNRQGVWTQPRGNGAYTRFGHTVTWCTPPTPWSRRHGPETYGVAKYKHCPIEQLRILPSAGASRSGQNRRAVQGSVSSSSAQAGELVIAHRMPTRKAKWIARGSVDLCGYVARSRSCLCCRRFNDCVDSASALTQLYAGWCETLPLYFSARARFARGSGLIGYEPEPPVHAAVRRSG